MRHARRVRVTKLGKQATQPKKTKAVAWILLTMDGGLLTIANTL